MNTKEALLIVMGIDKDHKPRAAIFAPADAQAAIKAASLLGFKVVRADSVDALALAKPLPEGRIFATGKGLLPLVKRETYDKLVKLVKPLDPDSLATPAAKAGPPAKGGAAAKAGTMSDTAKPSPTSPAAPSPSNPWDAIAVGSLVLWCAEAKEGWFECLVIAVSKDRKKLTLKWRDYPGYRPFEVPRVAVGLICKVS